MYMVVVVMMVFGTLPKQCVALPCMCARVYVAVDLPVELDGMSNVIVGGLVSVSQ